MKPFKYAPACDLSPLPGARCPWCTNDGTLCEFDICPLEEAHEANDEKKVYELRDQILKEFKESEGKE